MMRISGLASGIDTEKIIGDLMKAQRIPLDKITQKKQYLQWQMDDYRGINRNLKATSDKMGTSILLERSFMAKSVKVSNSDAVDIKSKNANSEFTGTIEVSQLATSGNWQSGGKITMGPNQNENSTLASLGITGSSITIASVDKNGVSDGGKTVTFDPNTDTMKSFLAKVNTETGVNAFFDTHTGKVAFTAKNSGEGSIAVTGDVGGSLSLAGASVTAGTNAKFTFNGLATERSSNTFDINGFEINLKQVTTAPVTFSSAPDTDKVMDVVVQFVDDYNKMIEELHAKIKEPKYRSFQPLSDEQKKEMKENEIKLWEEKAMSGTLRNDPEISSMLTKLRTIMSSKITTSDGSEMTLKDLGITSSSAYTENGKLTIDETKLRKAISDNPTNVYEVFSKTTTESAPGVVTDPGGLARQFRAVIDGSSKAIAAKAGSVGNVSDNYTLGRTMKEMNGQIDRFENKLKLVEARYWKQFNAMETAIQRANSQSASLMGAFGGGM